MLLHYRSGDEVRKGDRVTYAGETGEIEFVIAELSVDPALDWYRERFPGGGCMLSTAKLGRIFLREADEDLELVSRAQR